MSAPLEVVPAGTLPALPHRQNLQVSTGLATANLIYWAPVCERRESAAVVMKSKLDVRGFVRISPVMDVGMSVIPPRGWDLTRHVPQQNIPMKSPDAISPGEPVLWNAEPRPFNSSAAPLGEWAALPFTTIQLAGEVAAEVTEEVTGEMQAESLERPAAAATGQRPAPLVVEEIAAGKARPMQIFTAHLTSGLHARIPPLEAMPLRPTMVLGPAPDSANSGPPVANEKLRKPEVRILAPEKPAITQAEPQPADPVAQPVPQLDLGPQAPSASSGRSASKILTLFGGSRE